MYAPPAYPPAGPAGPAGPLTRDQARSKLIVQGIALAGCIVAAIPLTSSACCLLTLPFSIWAIVQLVKPEIREAFKQPA
jgi:hypothetical protein